MSESEFSDRPFVAGTVNGLRAFKVDKLGRLTGAMHELVWKPGENVAVCNNAGGYPRYLSYNYMPPSAFLNASMSGQIRAYLGVSEEAVKAPSPPHDVAGVNCSCGYYAYFDGTNSYGDEAGRVTGIVEGYGRVTIGSRGFRAEKARIVALVLPKPRRWHRNPIERMIDDNDWRVPLLAMLLALAVFMLGVVNAEHWWSALLGGFGAVGFFGGIASLVTTIKYAKREGWPPKADDNTDLIRRNYPEVPVYPTVKAALAAHPVKHPDPPKPIAPDTVDDFWTRSA